MMQEKLKERQEIAGESEVTPPSPPKRHEKWKRARLKPSGEYTSEGTRLVAEKIDALVAEGKFSSQGRNDILAKVIGPEHPGRVRAVGQGVRIRKFFGSCCRYDSTPHIINNDQLETLKIDLTKVIKAQVIQELSSLPFSQQCQNFPNSSPNPTLYSSTKGSSVMPHTPHDEVDILEKCELYIDGNTNVVAYANVYNLGSIIHNQVLNNDMLRVAVTKVLDANALLPVPTQEVTTLSEAINTFIQ
ncbi:uncharacterized protein LOC131640284 [Vicia villosa]|uniref:uncharacterized protein LOC131640284 n=1 Tax=Vicia villosa TaxID=3911 RepID=UPI00273C6755|nr:uncharacterized protein LOC131640284 [Vicia villosa]